MADLRPPSPATRAAQRGNALEMSATNAPPKGVRVTVTGVDTKTYTCAVNYAGNTTPISNVAWAGKYNDPSGRHGEVLVPKIGEMYELLTTHDGYMLGNSIPVTFLTESIAPHKVSYAGDDGADLQTFKGTRDLRGSMPADVRQGDWVRIGTKGNLIGILECGVSLFKATEKTKIVANPDNDHLSITAGTFTLDTDFGVISVKNDAGRVSLNVEGGSQQRTEASPREQKYTLHYSLGHTGAVSDFRVSDARGNDVAQTQYSADGSLVSLTAKTVETINGYHQSTVTGSGIFYYGVQCSFETGGPFTAVGSNVALLATASSASLVAATNAIIEAGQDVKLTAGQNHHVTVAGDKSNPTNIAHSTVVIDGSMQIDIGNPTLLPVARGAYTLTAKDEVSIGSRTGLTKIGMSSEYVPNTIYLSGNSFHAVLYEQLEAFFTAFGTALDAHTHPLGTGGTLIPSPIWAPNQSAFKLAKSTLIKYGG